MAENATKAISISANKERVLRLVSIRAVPCKYLGVKLLAFSCRHEAHNALNSRAARRQRPFFDLSVMLRQLHTRKPKMRWCLEYFLQDEGYPT